MKLKTTLILLLSFFTFRLHRKMNLKDLIINRLRKI